MCWNHLLAILLLTRHPGAHSSGVCAIHNFIISHQPHEVAIPDDDPNGLPGLHKDTNSAGDDRDEEEGDMGLHARIVIAIWDDYVRYHQALVTLMKTSNCYNHITTTYF